MSDHGRWIWQSASWPRLQFDVDQLGTLVARADVEQGRLLGLAEAIGADELSAIERDVWVGEAVATAAIEGEKLDLQSVRSSVARRLGITPSFVATVPRNVEGLLDVMEEAAARWERELSDEHLFGWQAALFPQGYSSLRTIETGGYRKRAEPMQIVSGPIGNETTHYEAPPSSAVRAEMRTFLDWFNGTRESGAVSGILRAGLAHVWFESIHPFEDGNGRIGRAIVDMALAQAARRPHRLHGLSAEMRRQQSAYYDALNAAQRGDGDVTQWLRWFIDAFVTSCQTSTSLINESLVRARFWSAHRAVEINERQRKALNKMLEAGPGRYEGGMTTRKYVGLTRTTAVTAARDLAELVGKGLLVREGAGRSTYYNLAIEGWGWFPKRRRTTAR